MLNGMQMQVVHPWKAKELCKEILKEVNRFHENLSETEEVGISFVSFGKGMQLRVEAIGSCGDFLIKFIGQLDDGSKMELLQHVNQVSILLVALKRMDPSEPKRQIGFLEEN